MALTVPSKRRNLRDFFSRNVSQSKLNTCNMSSSRTITTASESCYDDRPRREPRRVTFAEDIAVHFPGLRPPLTEEEHLACHYTRKELSNFEKDRGLTVLMYVKRKEAGIPWEEKDYTLRGLEEIVRQATQKVPTSQSPRERHAARVLQKVKDLKDCSQEDKDEKVRECSCQSSREDRVRALNRGKQDAVFASTGGSRRSFVVRNMIKSLSRRKLRTVKDA